MSHEKVAEDRSYSWCHEGSHKAISVKAQLFARIYRTRKAHPNQSSGTLGSQYCSPRSLTGWRSSENHQESSVDDTVVTAARAFAVPIDSKCLATSSSGVILSVIDKEGLARERT